MSYLPPPPATNQPPSNSNRTLWIILGSIGLVGVCMLLCVGIGAFMVLTSLGEPINSAFTEIQSELDENNSQFVLPSNESADTGAAIPIGTVQRRGDLEIAVTDARVIEGEGNITPEDYTQFLAVTVRVKNLGAQPASLTGMGPWSWIQDESGIIYGCCVFQLSSTELLNAELAAGAEIEATIVYEVADEPTPLFWVYQDDTDAVMVVELVSYTAATNNATTPIGIRAAVAHAADQVVE